MLRSDDVLGAAREAGFHLAGLARAEPLDASALDRWLERGLSASMSWMAERRAERLDPRVLFPGAKTVLALGCCVRTKAHLPSSPIALYAQGRDYHATMRDRLRALRRGLSKLSPAPKDYAEVDTGPVLEKVWAERAGLGWIGKNGMLVTPDHGSHVVLAVMLLDTEVDRYRAAPAADRCGRCTACLSACPTGAIVEPAVVDSRLCLSHQTIEDHGPYAEGLREHAQHAFGCDLCQDACPWNPPGHACDDPRFEPRPLAALSPLELALLDRARWRELTQGTAVARARFEGLRRNAAVVLGARRDPGCAALAPLAEDPDETVRAAAQWALARAGKP